jgi:hypothetical protein
MAVEVLLWHLVRTGTLEAEALADELERYARLSPTAARRLKRLARMVRYGKMSRKHQAAGLRLVVINDKKGGTC